MSGWMDELGCCMKAVLDDDDGCYFIIYPSLPYLTLPDIKSTE